MTEKSIQNNTVVKKQITIYDIAREAGVSPATVSRVLGNTAGVRKEKKEKVLELVEKYNFRPSAMARNLSDTRSRVIGMLVADIVNPFYATLYAECQKCAEEKGYTILLANTQGRLETELDRLDHFVDQRAEAIIHIGGSPDNMKFNEEYAKKITRISKDIPYILSEKMDGANTYAVRIDETEAMKMVMEYLYGLGHRRIALIGGHLNVSSTYDKYACYRVMLEKYGIPYDERLVVMDAANLGGYSIETGNADMEELIRRHVNPTAVIAVNETTAIGARQSLFQNGLRIPDDISLVCYDNTYLSNFSIPHMTTVDYDYPQFARMLIETAINAINGIEQPSLQMLEPKLAIRESTKAIQE